MGEEDKLSVEAPPGPQKALLSRPLPPSLLLTQAQGFPFLLGLNLNDFDPIPSLRTKPCLSRALEPKTWWVERAQMINCKTTAT